MNILKTFCREDPLLERFMKGLGGLAKGQISMLSLLGNLTQQFMRSHLVLALWLLLITSSASHTYGARQSQIFKMMKPNSQSSSPSTFMGFLPKGIPIPPSGPSKRHNDIGLQGSKSFP
ncbi:hypothetical protein POTOM_021669 [Populus tomentosa]|uniref:Uncharacterized protein n=1 Tax=Populus tomentosa TaxID=118781 RepID=A0A8X7ZRM4_POPTO|nr:hypothetical protein POTOM_021669 [Populus tomentosa]